MLCCVLVPEILLTLKPLRFSCGLVNSAETYPGTIWYDITMYSQFDFSYGNLTMRAIFASRKLTVLLFHGNIKFGYFHCLKPVLSLHALARTPKGFGKQGNTIFYFKGTRNRNFDNKK